MKRKEKKRKEKKRKEKKRKEEKRKEKSGGGGKRNPTEAGSVQWFKFIGGLELSVGQRVM
jgi:hypothetical protein